MLIKLGHATGYYDTSTGYKYALGVPEDLTGQYAIYVDKAGDQNSMQVTLGLYKDIDVAIQQLELLVMSMTSIRGVHEMLREDRIIESEDGAEDEDDANAMLEDLSEDIICSDEAKHQDKQTTTSVSGRKIVVGKIGSKNQ